MFLLWCGFFGGCTPSVEDASTRGEQRFNAHRASLKSHADALEAIERTATAEKLAAADAKEVSAMDAAAAAESNAGAVEQGGRDSLGPAAVASLAPAPVVSEGPREEPATGKPRVVASPAPAVATSTPTPRAPAATPPPTARAQRDEQPAPTPVPRLQLDDLQEAHENQPEEAAGDAQESAEEQPPGADSEPPILIGIHFDPPETSDNEEVMVQIDAIDNMSGVKVGTGALTSPSRKVFIPFSVSIDAATQTLIGTVRIPAQSEAGMWHVASLRLSDNAQNTSISTPNDSPVLTSARLVVFAKQSDSEPPRLESLELSPARVDDGGQVTVTLRVVDEGAGVAQVRGILSNPSGSVQLNFYPHFDGTTGNYIGSVPLPEHSEYGEWRVTLLTLTDKANNRGTLTKDDQRLARAFVSVESSSSDTTPPVLLSITIEPGRVASGEMVEVTAYVSDDLSGVKAVNGWSVLDSARVPFSLRGVDGADQFKGSIRIPPQAANGQWRIERLTVTDTAGNRTLLTSREAPLIGATFEVFAP